MKINSVIKRTICVFLATLLLLISCACNSGQQNMLEDENVLSLFFDSISHGQYVEAYSFLSESIAVENGEYNSKKSDNAITLKEFEDIYRDVYEILEIESSDYSIISEKVGETTRTINVKLTYHSAVIGDIESEYSVSLILENGVWKIDWTPALIFPEMTWGDTVIRAKLSARRGDILANGEIIAKTVDLTTVYALLTQIADEEELYNRIIARENLELIALEELNKLTDWNQLTQQERDSLLLERVMELAEDKLIEYIHDDENEGLLTSLCPDEIDSIAAALEQIIGLKREDFDKALKNAYGSDGSCTLAQYYPGELTPEQQEALKEIPGIYVQDEGLGTGRVYPYESLLAHTLGYLAPANENDIAKFNDGRDAEDGLYSESSYVGRSGIERLYEIELRGKDGYYYGIRGEDGAIKRILFKKDKEDGIDVNLTIDLDLQKRVEEVLDLVMYGEDTSGAVVVMNPKTGEINAIASYPTYDLNSIFLGVDGYYTAMLNQENGPLRNRATDGAYPPGSTFKVFTAAAVLDNNIVTKDYIFKGEIEDDYWTPTEYGNWIWPRIKRTTVDKRETPMNMANSMLHSDNIYFADLALKLGEERFIEYMHKLGVDMDLPFELGGANTQIVSYGTTMSYKQLADSGYGQGQILMTPLQVATIFCSLRNDGDIPAPYVTKSFYATEGNDYHCISETEPSIWIENAIKVHTINTLIPMLEGVVDPEKHGTGRSLRVESCDVAAKTGTAELDNEKNRIISWFVGFRINVDEEDERVVLVMLEVPNTSEYTSLKFDIARELLEIEKEVDPNASPVPEQ